MERQEERKGVEGMGECQNQQHEDPAMGCILGNHLVDGWADVMDDQGQEWTRLRSAGARRAVITKSARKCHAET